MAAEQFRIAGRQDGRLYVAVTRGYRQDVLDELRQGDIDLTMTIGGKSMLRHAGERGHRQICSILIEHGADPDEVSGRRRYSLLHAAAASHNFGFASELLTNHANPSPRSSNDDTPLHFAARTGQGFLAKQLIDFNANVDAQDTSGRTPLYLAMINGHTHLAKLFVKANSNPAIVDRKGNSARHVAETLGLVL